MSEKIKNNTKKEDGRIRYTKMRIRTAFYELLKEVSLDKITVTALCERAEINRATFYKHYLDVPDLADKLQEETLERLSQKFDAASNEGDIKIFIIETLKYLKENNEGHSILEIITPEGESTFTLKISALLFSKFSEFVGPYVKTNSQDEKAILYSYLAGGSAGVINFWIKTSFKESEEAIADKIIKLASSTIHDFPNDNKEKSFGNLPLVLHT